MFRLDPDRMVACWTVGEEDLAMALVEIDGFEIARAGAGVVEKYQHAGGWWERRIVYATKGRERDRANKRAAAEKRAARAGAQA